MDPRRADIEAHFRYLIEEPLIESWKRQKELKELEPAGDVDMGGERLDQGHKKSILQRPVVILDSLDG